MIYLPVLVRVLGFPLLLLLLCVPCLVVCDVSPTVPTSGYCTYALNGLSAQCSFSNGDFLSNRDKAWLSSSSTCVADNGKYDDIQNKTTTYVTVGSDATRATVIVDTRWIRGGTVTYLCYAWFDFNNGETPHVSQALQTLPRNPRRPPTTLSGSWFPSPSSSTLVMTLSGGIGLNGGDYLLLTPSPTDCYAPGHTNFRDTAVTFTSTDGITAQANATFIVPQQPGALWYVCYETLQQATSTYQAYEQTLPFGPLPPHPRQLPSSASMSGVSYPSSSSPLINITFVGPLFQSPSVPLAPWLDAHPDTAMLMTSPNCNDTNGAIITTTINIANDGHTAIATFNQTTNIDTSHNWYVCYVLSWLNPQNYEVWPSATAGPFGPITIPTAPPTPTPIPTPTPTATPTPSSSTSPNTTSQPTPRPPPVNSSSASWCCIDCCSVLWIFVMMIASVY